MTRYTVVWHEEALNQLAEIWMDTADRQAVTQATQTIDTQLGNDAESKGVLVEGGLRQLTSPPLRVVFGVSEPDRLVKVLHATTA